MTGPWRVAVSGDSMAPGLRDGDWVLVLPLSRPRVGDVVVLRDPWEDSRLLVKRVRAVQGRTLRIGSDGPHAAHHVDRGDVPSGRVLGRAVLRYSPLARFGPIR